LLLAIIQRELLDTLSILRRSTDARRLPLFIRQISCKNGSAKNLLIHGKLFESKCFIICRKSSDGLFLEVSREVAKEYPDIEHNDMIIDNCCMQLVSKPHQFDVMLMTNLYGTIVSNVICGLIGGAGLLSGRNYGNEVS